MIARLLIYVGGHCTPELENLILALLCSTHPTIIECDRMFGVVLEKAIAFRTLEESQSPTPNTTFFDQLPSLGEMRDGEYLQPIKIEMV
jgi:hypothetical protein